MSVTIHRPAPVGAASLVPATMDQAVRLAEMMAQGRLVPNHLQKSPGDCLMVVEMAMRFGMSPFAVAQCTSVIQGKLMLEGKLVAAALHGSGALETRLDYQYEGEGDTRSVVVSATLAGETAPRTLTIRLRDVKTSNALWTKQPDQQLAYSGARNWARRYAPEVMLGVYSPEEMETTPAPAFGGTTIEAVNTREAINAAVPLAGQPANPDLEGDGIPALDPAPKRPTSREWLDALEAELKAAADGDVVDEIIARADVQKALDKLSNGAKDRLNAMIKAALDRTGEEMPPVEEAA